MNREEFLKSGPDYPPMPDYLLENERQTQRLMNQYSIDEVNGRIQRLALVARLADDWRLSNDVSDELHDALDTLQPGDY